MFLVVYTYHVGNEQGPFSPIVSPLLKYHVYLMVSMGALGIAVGASVFYVMSSKVDREHSIAQSNAQTLMRFLSSDEQVVVNLLLTNKGTLLQSKISRETNLGRVKVHRITTRLAEKRVVTIEDYGKTNVIALYPEIESSLR